MNLAGERIVVVAFVLNGLLVLAGVYVGALRRARDAALTAPDTSGPTRA